MSQPLTSGAKVSYWYPGLGKDLRYLNQNFRRRDLYPLGFNQDCHGSISEILLVREVAMMIVMDRLSDKPEFHRQIFDDAIAAKWIEECLEIPDKVLRNQIVSSYSAPKRLKNILDEECLEYCIQELRAKAKYFERTGLIPTLDASASICKSDTLIDRPLRDALRAAFKKIQSEQESKPNCHPGMDEKVQDLVDPSLYPLVYGKTRLFAAEVVGIDDAIDKWAGRGDVIPEPQPTPNTSEFRWFTLPSWYWSDNYQWLPANVKLQSDGSVKFTSYINNLHPIKHREMYGLLEKLIEKAIPAWDTCVATNHNCKPVSGGRTAPRFPFPDEPDDENQENWTPQLDEVEMSEDEDNIRQQDPGSTDCYGETAEETYWQMIREPVQPPCPRFKAWKYGPETGETLQEKCKSLQIIVKMTSIELTPEKPNFPLGGWHVDGQMNERIVGTALYYLDSENITPSRVQFRMHTTYDINDNFNVGQDSFSWVERVYGTQLYNGANAPCLQNYGSVEAKEGRLLAFPSVFHHRVSPFELKDKTKPGHQRFIVLWLVDPKSRVINTANVPPQQQDWWMNRAFQNLRESEAYTIAPPIAQMILNKAPWVDNLSLKAAAQGTKNALPIELMTMLAKEFDDALPMSYEEAEQHRVKLMDIRTTFLRKTEKRWEQECYIF